MPIAPNIEVSNNTSTLGGNTSGVVIDGVDVPAIVQGNLVITGSLTALGPIVISGGAIPITDIAGVPALVPYFDATGFMGTDPTFGFNDTTKTLSTPKLTAVSAAVGSFSNQVDINGDTYSSINAVWTGTQWNRIDTTKPSWLHQTNINNNMLNETYHATTFWRCQPGANPIGAYTAIGGWLMIQSYSEFGDVTYGGNGFEIDGNGTIPYGRMQHTTISGVKKTTLLTNAFLDESGRDDITSPSWQSGFFDNSYKIRQAPAGASLAWSDLLTVTPTSVTVNGNLNMGSKVISNLADGLAYTDAVNYGQLTTLAGGIVYLNPTLVSVLISDNLTTPPASPVAGRGYIAAATAGGWTAGHLYVRDDTNTIWVDLTGAPIQVGAILGVNMEDMQTPGGGLTGHNHQIATVTGNTPGAFTYSFYTPLQTNATYINGAYIDFGHLYYYNGTVWIDLLGGATLQPGAGVGLAYNGQVLNSTGVFGIPISATTGTFTGNVTAPNFIGTASNASQLNGQFAAYYAPVSNPSFTTNATFNNGGATSIFVGPTSGGVSYYGDAGNAAIRTNGSVYFQNASGTVTNAILGPTGLTIGGANMNSIGIAQTWGYQARATNTWYTNTTGRPIAVVFFGQNSTTIQDIAILVNGGPTATYTRLTNPHATTASIIIPPGGTYYYQQIGPASGNYFMQELR